MVKNIQLSSARIKKALSFDKHQIITRKGLKKELIRIGKHLVVAIVFFSSKENADGFRSWETGCLLIRK